MNRLGFPGGASGKEPPCQCRRHKRCLFNPWVGRIPWRRAWQPTPAFLPGESHRQRSQWATVHRVGKSGHNRNNLTRTQAEIGRLSRYAATDWRVSKAEKKRKQEQSPHSPELWHFLPFMVRILSPQQMWAAWITSLKSDVERDVQQWRVKATPFRKVLGKEPWEIPWPHPTTCKPIRTLGQPGKFESSPGKENQSELST